MKKTFSILAIALTMLALTGCEPDNKLSQDEIMNNLVGTWKLAALEGKDCPTNNKFVITYEQNGTRFSSASQYFSTLGKWVWAVKTQGYYFVSDGELVEYNQTNSAHFSVEAIDKHQMDLHETKAIIDGKDMPLDLQQRYVRISDDNTMDRDIVGLWEGLAMTGDSTHGDADHRWRYNDDGTYVYYIHGEGDSWIPGDNKMNEYNIHGDWLATRWTESNDVTNYEWWDVDYIRDGVMQWSALRTRDDGSTFVATFTLKRVNEEN